MEDTRLAVFLFLFLYALLFFLLVFSSFRTLSIISSVGYFLIEALPIQKHLSDQNFRNCLFTKKVLTEQVVHISF